MKKRPILTALLTALLLLIPAAKAGSIGISALDWEVQFLIDQSQTVLGDSQFSGPRSGRGLALSPDGRYIYAGYNNPNSDPGSGKHPKQVRKIDTTIADFTDATVAILENNRGKALATDDLGRVYIAEGSDTDTADGPGVHIYNADLDTLLFSITPAVGGLSKPEGVAATRESGDLILYVSDRGNQTLNRFKISEGAGVAVTGISKEGLGGTGVLDLSSSASDLRGVEVDPAGRIWVVDIDEDIAFRVDSDGTGLTSASVTSPMDIAFDDTNAFISQETARTVAVLDQGAMSPLVGSPVAPPFAALSLDPDGQSGNGQLTGIDIHGGEFFVANGLGQTPDEKSTYGRCDAESDNDGGDCTITDQTHDDNEPILRAATADTECPVISNISPTVVEINTGFTVTANVDDSGTGGSAISSAVFEISTTDTAITLQSGPMSASDSTFDEINEDVEASVAGFAETGVHELCVQATDSAGNGVEPPLCEECVLLAIFDPSDGFVTGGGGVDSPSEADLLTGASGPATFGFVSKYLKGRSTPDGNLQFQFKAGDVKFHSTSMEWLVVTGEPRAMFRGEGQVNDGQTTCKFEVDAWDESFTGGVDAFGLKLFACGPDGDVQRYSLDATPLTKGSIKIHKKK